MRYIISYFIDFIKKLKDKRKDDFPQFFDYPKVAMSSCIRAMAAFSGLNR